MACYAFLNARRFHLSMTHCCLTFVGSRGCPRSRDKFEVPFNLHRSEAASRIPAAGGLATGLRRRSPDLPRRPDGAAGSARGRARRPHERWRRRAGTERAGARCPDLSRHRVRGSRRDDVPGLPAPAAHEARGTAARDVSTRASHALFDSPGARAARSRSRGAHGPPASRASARRALARLVSEARAALPSPTSVGAFTRLGARPTSGRPRAGPEDRACV